MERIHGAGGIAVNRSFIGKLCELARFGEQTFIESQRVETAREALVQLTTDASSLGEGRRFVAQTLRTWQADEARIEPVQLVANELVANAIVHAHSAPVLSLEVAGPDLMVRVADDSPSLPVARGAATEIAGGRGLILVEALADRWGIDANPQGKIVWAKFAGTFG